MHIVADAMADVVADDAVAIGLGKRLHRMAKVSQMVARDSFLDCSLQAVARAFAEATHLVRYLTDIECPGIVSGPTVHIGSGIDGDDVALAQLRRGRRDAVHDLLVH